MLDILAKTSGLLKIIVIFLTSSLLTSTSSFICYEFDRKYDIDFKEFILFFCEFFYLFLLHADKLDKLFLLLLETECLLRRIDDLNWIHFQILLYALWLGRLSSRLPRFSSKTYAAVSQGVSFLALYYWNPPLANDMFASNHYQSATRSSRAPSAYFPVSESPLSFLRSFLSYDVLYWNLWSQTIA